MVLTRGWGEKNEKFNRYRMSVWDDEVLELDDGWWWWFHVNVSVVNTAILNGKNDKLYFSKAHSQDIYTNQRCLLVSKNSKITRRTRMILMAGQHPLNIRGKSRRSNKQ
jgi:hypothetical protein